MLPDGEVGRGATGVVDPGNVGASGAVGGGGTTGFEVEVRGAFVGGAGLRMRGGVIS
jgi:hypothetical protein